jgi:restriction endonuclease S subunit
MLNVENMISLKNICYIRSGQTFKSSWDSYQKGDTAIIQPKDLLLNEVEMDLLTISDIEIPSLDKHLLQHGDIAIVNRGTRFNTWMYEGIPKKTVVTNAFYVISINPIKMLPKFLNWYLGQQEAKDYFDLNATGTTIRGINKTVLMELPVPNIPIKLQSHIVELVEKAQEEQQLLHDLQKSRKDYTESYIWEQIKKY